jgi:LemA protein
VKTTGAAATTLYSPSRQRNLTEADTRSSGKGDSPMLTLLILAVLVVLLIVVYNGLVQLQVRADSAWADIDVQLKRRYDLVPNLVETVKGYAAHERGTLEAVVDARSRAMSAQGPAARAEAENMLTGALKSLFALAEAYPQLRAAENFGQLQQQLSQIEDAVQRARTYYNAVVRDLNTRIRQFPSNLVARPMGFRTREFFEIADSDRTVPQVSF